jgi:hypothetical protein
MHSAVAENLESQLRKNEGVEIHGSPSCFPCQMKKMQAACIFCPGSPAAHGDREKIPMPFRGSFTE